MKTTPAKIEFARLPKDYAGLCRTLMPPPIHDKVDFENVAEITDAMAGHKLTPDQEDYFDLLCRLIEDYEREHAQLDTYKVTALDALQHLLDAHDMSAADLARLLDVHRTLGAMRRPRSPFPTASFRLRRSRALRVEVVTCNWAVRRESGGTQIEYL